MSKPRIAILGAGPVGLEAALAAAEGGYPFTVYEAAPSAEGNSRFWGHCQMFAPWDLNVSLCMRRRILAPSGSECPTGQELAGLLLDPNATHRVIEPYLRLGTRAPSLGREGL